MIAAPPPPPARVQVVAQEFRYALSRQTIKAGWAIVELRNGGEDVHDLVVLDGRGRRLATSGEIGAGVRATIRVTLRRTGTYRLLCTRDDHAARGMRARLRVRPLRRPAR